MTITRGDGKSHGKGLDPVRFLVGHFEGEARLPDERCSIRKEVIGSCVPHALQAVAVHKVLVAEQKGFAERLEFDRGLGLFETYYTMLFRRHHGGHDRA